VKHKEADKRKKELKHTEQTPMVHFFQVVKMKKGGTKPSGKPESNTPSDGAVASGGAGAGDATTGVETEEVATTGGAVSIMNLATAEPSSIT